MRIDVEFLYKKAKEELKYPFSLNINPFMEPLAKESIKWGQNYELLKTNEDYQKIVSYCPWVLSSYVFPNLSYDLLSLVSDWFYWVFLFKDNLYENIHKKAGDQEPNRISILFSEYHNALYLKENNFQNHLAMPLKNIMERFSKHSSKAWFANFRKNMEHFFEANQRSLFHMISRNVPQVLEFCQLMISSSALLPLLEIVELSLGEKISKNFKKSDSFQEIYHIISNICVWSNDIYSFPKKMKNGNLFNLLNSIMVHQNLNFEKALEKVILMHHAEVEKFKFLEKEVLIGQKYLAEEKNEIQLWFEALKACMIGIWCWTLESDKYQMTLNERTNLVFFDVSSSEMLPL